MPDIGTALVTLATAAMTGGVALLGVHVTNRATAKRTQEQRLYDAKQQERGALLDKAEELYQLTDKWLGGFSAHFLHLVPVMRGQTDYNTYLDTIIEYGKAQEIKFVRIEMLIGIYFEELRHPYEDVLRQREVFNNIIHEHKTAYKQGHVNGERFVEPLTKAALELDALGAALKSAIAQAARRMVNAHLPEASSANSITGHPPKIA